MSLTPAWTPRPLPWRATLAAWPDEWRERWGRRANDYEDAGLPWFEAEALAFEDTVREMSR